VLYVISELRASGIGCRRAASLVRPHEPWPCEVMPESSEVRCWNRSDRRKWFTYEHGGVLPRPGRFR
jgi:hypothetical protein